MTGSVRLSLGLPVQRFSITVQHSTPRVPNPLEAALIHMVLRLGALPHYRERSLVQLYTEMLCLPQPELWLAPMLQELVDIRLLTCARHLDDVDAVTLGHLALTERGQTMVSNGKLLGRPQRTSVTWCWDPVALEVRNPQQWERLSKDAPALALPADAYEDIFPMETFRAGLAGEAWYRPGETEIEAVTVAGGPEVAWEPLAVDVTLEGARLVCSTARPAVRQYLQEQKDALLTSQLAAAMFGPGYAEGDGWPQVTLTASDRFLSLPRIAQQLGRAREVAYDEVALAEFDGIERGIAAGVRIHYADTDATEDVEYSAEQGHSIVTGRRLPAADCNIVSDGEGWRLCRVNVRIGQLAVAVPVALQMPGARSVTDPVLARALLDTRQEAMIGAALRVSAATIWPVLLRELRETLEGKDCLDMVLAWLTEMAKLDSTASKVVDRDALQEMFSEALRAHGRIDAPGELTSWRIAMQALEPPNPKALLEQLLGAAYPAASVRGLHAMTDEAKTVVKDYCIRYGPATYARSLVAELLSLNSLEEVKRVLRNPNPFECQLRALWEDGAAMARTLGTTFPVPLPAPNALARILRERKNEACIGVIRKWRADLDGFYHLAQVEQPGMGSPFEISRAGIQEWEAQLVRSAASDAGHFDHVFVADTNALINMPQLPLKMTGNVLLVLPLVVLQELDRKKQDPTLRKACSEAVRLLRDMPDSRRRYEESDLARLPADFDDKADNRILSVAMKYHHPNLRLITDDENLRTAAESMKITAVKVERFGDGFAARSQAQRQAARKHQHKRGPAQ